MKKIYLLATLLLAVSIFYLVDRSSSTSPYLLGEKNGAKVIKTPNSIVWRFYDAQWHVSKEQNDLNISKSFNGYVLINNNDIDYKMPIHKSKFYSIKKGWNYFGSTKDGIAIAKTFAQHKEIQFIYTYDKHSTAWAGYSPDKLLLNKIMQRRILLLKYIEPKKGFYVYSDKDVKVAVKSTSMTNICQKKIDTGKFETLLSSGVSKDMVFSETHDIGVKSRYLSHQKRGIYDDTRVMLIYSKLPKSSSAKKLLHYGPAVPKVMLSYDKKYQNKNFYMYDFFKKECYLGIFPSRKIPPFSTLKKLR